MEGNDVGRGGVMETLAAVSAWLAKETPPFITAVAVLSFFMPGLFGWVRGDVQSGVLGVIMLAMGMTLTKEDFRILASRPLDIAFGSLVQFIAMPALAWCVVHMLGLSKGVAVGLILVGCCPGGVSSNIMTFLCKGDVAFSVGLTTLSTLAAPLTTPLLMLFLAGETIDVDAAGMFKSILLVTLLPVSLGFALNTAFGKTARYAKALRVMPGVAVLGLACIVGGVVSAQGSEIVKSGLLILAAVFLHNTTGYVVGYLAGVLARFTRPKRRTVSIEVGMQNAGLATVLAARHFPALPEAAMASAVSCVWHSITGALLAGIFNAADKWTARSADSARARAEVGTGPASSSSGTSAK